MQGAHGMGDIVARGEAAQAAGCDMLLVCNHPEEAVRLLDGLKAQHNPVSQLRLARMHERHPLDFDSLRDDPAWQQAVTAAEALLDHENLQLEV